MFQHCKNEDEAQDLYHECAKCFCSPTLSVKLLELLQEHYKAAVERIQTENHQGTYE